MQDCLNIVARVRRRFYKIVNDSGALWRSLKTDAEFDVDSFELVIVNHAKHFRDLALQFSQKRVRYNSPAMHIENSLALCENLRHLHLSYNTSIITIEFIGEINCLTSLILTGFTSIEPNNTMNCLKYGSYLKVLKISHCQFGDEHVASLIDVVVKNLTSLEIFHAENTALFSIDNAREILETRDLKELALSPNWGPPPIWADFLEEYQHVYNFGEHFKAHLERIKLTNFLYSDEEEDL